MAAGSVSLESALRTCKVDTSLANRIESDRFLNPHNMVCPVWNGMDTSGRHVCPDSFYTKRAGCNSAKDRIDVENTVSRPQYMEYITLSPHGISGQLYGTTDQYQESLDRHNELNHLKDITGNFGNQLGSNIQSNCGYSKHETHDHHHANHRPHHDNHHDNHHRTPGPSVRPHHHRTPDPSVGPTPGPTVGHRHAGYPGSNNQRNYAGY